MIFNQFYPDTHTQKRIKWPSDSFAKHLFLVVSRTGFEPVTH